jgi:hypothetical protein
MKKLNDLKKDGVLDENEYQVLVSKNKPALESCEKEIENFLESKDTVFNSVLKVIELLRKAYNYIDLGNDLLAKAKMAKIVLSNPVLVDGSIGFSYENPFDNLLKNLTQKKWWRKEDATRTSLHPLIIITQALLYWLFTTFQRQYKMKNF